jgi:GT2 family glycosyltransferase
MTEETTVATVDVLIPTFSRPAALAVTLAGLCGQEWRDFRVVVSSQDDDDALDRSPEVQTMIRLLRHRGHGVEVQRHLPRRGLAEHRQWLLDQADAPYVLYLDDDVFLEPPALRMMVDAILRTGCGFIGSAPIGLSFADDHRPQEQDIELWDDDVRPEEIRPDVPAWERHRLHNAANLLHVQERLDLGGAEYRLYRVAWVGGCVLYDREALREAGAYGFWQELPSQHAGEDVLAQLRVLARRGGAGIIPSHAFHQELPTTVPDRRVDAPVVIGV